MTLKKHIALVLLAFLIIVPTATTYAAGKGEKPIDIDWGFEGPFGTFDRAAQQRGLKVYREVCAACHGIKRIAFRNLEALGYDEGQVKAIAAEYTVTDGPDEEGDMFDRPARPSDRFPKPFANDNLAKVANNGALPPDLSLIVKARKNGADYLYSLLNGYEDPPEGKKLLAGQYWNKYMPGNVIAMPPQLLDDQIIYEDGTPQTTSQYSKDLVEFLAWAAEPEIEERKRMGIMTLIFLTVFAGIMYAIKKKIWADVH
ncbi:MAG: cytochrome c1 [Pseudomonadota bacterium]